MYQCSKCNQIFKSKQQLGGHARYCKPIKKQKEKVVKEEYLQSNGKYKCPYCDKEFSKMGISTHIWRKHKNGINFKPRAKGLVAWNKGLTKETDERILKSSQKLSIRIKNGEIAGGGNKLWRLQ